MRENMLVCYSGKANLSDPLPEMSACLGFDSQLMHFSVAIVLFVFFLSDCCQIMSRFES